MLTVDRALLAGVLAVGVWIGTNDIRRADLETRLVAIEPQVAELKTSKAVVDTKLENIEKLLQSLIDKLDRQDRTR